MNLYTGPGARRYLICASSIEKEKGEAASAPGIAHEGARVQFAPGDLAGRTATSIWVYAQLERSRMVR